MLMTLREVGGGEYKIVLSSNMYGGGGWGGGGSSGNYKTGEGRAESENFMKG